MNTINLRRPSAAFANTNTNSSASGVSASARFASSLRAIAALRATPLARFAESARVSQRVLAIVAVTAFCVLMASAPAFAADTATAAASQNASAPKWFADAGLLVQGSSDLTTVGFNVRAGCYLNESNRLTLDVGAGFDVNPKTTGHFAYTINNGPVRYDGKIQVNHTIVPVMFGWEHEWKTSSAKWAWRLGPTAGVAFVSGKEERDPHVSNASNVFRSASGAAFLAGVNAGVRWNFLTSAPRLYLDFSVAGFGSTGVKLDKLYNEKINLSGGRLIVACGYQF